MSEQWEFNDSSPGHLVLWDNETQTLVSFKR